MGPKKAKELTEAPLPVDSKPFIELNANIYLFMYSTCKRSAANLKLMII
jgi:hypothetical protein